MTKRYLRMGFGFMHNETDTVPMGKNMAAYGHTGTGGAFAWCDRDRNMSFSYCTNFQREGPGIGPRGAALAVAAGGGQAASMARQLALGQRASAHPRSALLTSIDSSIGFINQSR